MSQRMRELTIETPNQVFGAELRHWRTLRGLSQTQLGALTRDSGSLIGMIEKADRVASRGLAQRADRALNTGGALESMWLRLERAAAETRTDTTEDSRQVFPHNPWATLAVPDLLREWHADTTGFTIGLTSIGHRRVGRVDIDIMWSMGDALATADHHLGGGYARASLTAFLTGTVASALRGVYDTATASELHTVSARLANLAGFMHFDTARHRAAIGWFHTALALAKAGGNGALGAHILSDMAMQAHHQRRPADAVALAEAAVTTARHSGSPVTFARSSALLARAHALAGDRAAAARALTDAGRHLDRVIVDDEPAWVRFFNAEQLAAEIMYVAADSAQDTLVQRHAPLVLGSTGAMERRHVLASAALASAQLAGRAGDIDHAAQTLSDALPTASTVVSSRGLDAINAVRRQLARYPDRPSVLALENLYARTMVPVK